MRSLQSKTVLGLIVLLVVAGSLTLAGKLTPEMVEVIKYIGTAYMSVRGVANIYENKYRDNSINK